ncbi:MAG: hypothetical protein HDQ98_11710 [Lachnospiraceae bacterium]|nr:hypothetical protein [Lachnospiraceae bacterium]
MSGGLIDGALSAIETDLQGEPTPTPSADESTPTPTAEPTPTEEPTPEPTGAPSPAPDEEPEETEKSEEIHNTPAPSLQGTQTVVVSSDYMPEDYTEQIALMQETLETLVLQNEEQATRLYHAELVNAFLLTIILAVLLPELFWRRILR